MRLQVTLSSSMLFASLLLAPAFEQRYCNSRLTSAPAHSCGELSHGPRHFKSTATHPICASQNFCISKQQFSMSLSNEDLLNEPFRSMNLLSTERHTADRSSLYRHLIRSPWMICVVLLMTCESRFGWRTQRALNSGQDPRVTKIRVSPKMPILWVTAPSPEGPTFLLNRVANGSIWLLNVDAEDVPKVKLALSTKHTVEPFISADGRLQLIEVLGDPESDDLCNLCWHTLDTSTGELLLSQQKLRWHPSLSKQSAPCRAVGPYQSTAQRVLAMADPHTIVVLDACSLRELVRILVTLRGSQIARTDYWISSLRWAPFKPWVAVVLQGKGSPAPQGIYSEVHIYDAASGECLQYVTLCTEAKLTWSPSLALAAVVGVLDTWDPARHSPTTEQPAPCEGLADLGTIRILDPARRAVMEVRGEEAAETGWRSCKWSPGGALLIAGYGSRDPHCSIFDGSTGQAVMRSDLSWKDASWASEVEAAYLPEALDNVPMYIQFEQIHGTWRANQQKMHGFTSLQRLREALISPDGSTIAGWMYGDGSRVRHNWTKSIFHHNLHTGQGHSCIKDWLRSAPGGSIFAPLPRAWPQVTAYIYVPYSKYRLLSPAAHEPRSLKLVGGQAHAVHGSWTVADLLELSQGAVRLTANPCDMLEVCIWAPNGRHLVVFCNLGTWALVVTFREPAYLAMT